LDLAVLPEGNILNIADGKIMLKVMGSLNYPSPAVIGDTVYFIGARSSAVKVTLDEKGTLKYDLVWMEDLEGEFCVTGLIYEGLVYTANNDGVLFIHDAKTGARVFADMIAEKTGGLIYGGFVLAGKYIVFTNEGGKTCLMNPGQKFDPVAINELEGKGGATPVFEGSLMYTRAGDYLYCIAKKKD